MPREKVPEMETAQGKAEEGVGSLVENPLLQNPLILARLFQLCPPKVLSNARLVCKQWRDVSLPIWRANRPLTFRLLSNKIHLGNHFTPLDNYLEYVKDPSSDCETKPFLYMKLADWKFTSNIVQYKEFMSGLSHTVTVLELHGCYFPNTEGFRKVIYKVFPNMQRLIISNCYFRNAASLEKVNEWEYSDPTHGEHKNLRYIKVTIDQYSHSDTRFHPYQLTLPVTWLELLSHFQNLTSLSFIVEHVKFIEMRRERQGLLNAIKLVRGSKGRDKLPLKFLAISPVMEVFPSNEELYQELRLPLDTVIIRVQEGTDGPLVKTILELHAPSLRRVEISNREYAAGSLRWNFLPLDVPCFEKLCHFQLLELLFDSSLEFLKFMPRLRGLELLLSVIREADGSIIYIKVQLISDACRLELSNLKLMDLTYFACCYIVEDEDLAMLIRWMPNLKKLEMVLNDRQFGMVCQGWPNLKRLKVLGQLLTDAGITGRKTNVPQGNSNPGGDEGGVEETVEPNIKDLQNLKSFSFWSKNVTEASVLNGIVGLANLKILQPILAEPLQLGKDATYILSVKRIKVVGPEGNVSEDEDDE